VLGVTAAPVEAGRPGRDLGRETLRAGDGWAALDTGTTGGAAADAAHVFVVRTWDEFRAALGGTAARGDTTPRIVYVEGRIDANTGPGGTVRTCSDYADPGYSLDAYLAAYDPAVWGTETRPSGPLEEARARSQATQNAQVRQFVGSNVTIVGRGPRAQLVGASLTVRGSTNVIIRNLRLSDAYDCFPGWDPGDGSGAWNSQYDNVWVVESTHVWVDHVTFDDGAHPPASLPERLGVKYEVHDGLLDITNNSDLVTVSYNRFVDHDKTMLIGSSNTRYTDRGTLRVTVHHNVFDGTTQRLPRVRFGQVHVYDNHYVLKDPDDFLYAWGVGVESQLYAESNVFTLGRKVPVGDLVYDWGGTMIQASDTWVAVGPRRPARVDVAAAYNATHEPDLATEVGWEPVLHGRIDPAPAIPALLARTAGAGRTG